MTAPWGGMERPLLSADHAPRQLYTTDRAGVGLNHAVCKRCLFRSAAHTHRTSPPWHGAEHWAVWPADLASSSLRAKMSVVLFR